MEHDVTFHARLVVPSTLRLLTLELILSHARVPFAHILSFYLDRLIVIKNRLIHNKEDEHTVYGI